MLLAFVITLVAVLLAGAVLVWIISGNRSRDSESRQRNEQLSVELGRRTAALDAAQTTLAARGEQIARLETENAHFRQASQQTIEALQRSEIERDQLRDQTARLLVQIAELNTALDKERAGFQDKLALLTSAREELSNQFEVLASKILEEKSKRFTEQNQANLGNLLTPLKEKFGEFQQKVADLHDEGLKGRTQFKDQFERLERLNERLSEDATNLVNALKGSGKTQGDWGEKILEIILERSGFTQGVHYFAQQSFSREDDEDKRRARPDIVINLPGDKQLIVDAKVSLLDYADYCNSDDEATRQAALSRHSASVRRHIKDLSEQKYQTLPDIQSLDFVVMFVPVEPALQLIDKDGKLWQEAWRKNVLLATPSTLLFVVRIVDNLWHQEQQQKNVEEIVRRGRELYDKLAAFAKDLTEVGKGLDAARGAYDEAYKKLAQGKGNVIRQAEMLKSLGVKPTKALPSAMLDLAMTGEPGELFEDLPSEEPLQLNTTPASIASNDE
jgi:DNA recombination protein RmuC